VALWMGFFILLYPCLVKAAGALDQSLEKT